MMFTPPSTKRSLFAKLASDLCHLVLVGSAVLFLSGSSCYYSGGCDDDDWDDDDHCHDDDDHHNSSSGARNSPEPGSSGLGFGDMVTPGVLGDGSVDAEETPADAAESVPDANLEFVPSVLFALNPLRLTSYRVFDAQLGEPFEVERLGDISGASIRNLLGDGIFGAEQFAWYADRLLASNRDLLGWPAGVEAQFVDVRFEPETVEVEFSHAGAPIEFETLVTFDLFGDLVEIRNRTTEGQ